MFPDDDRVVALFDEARRKFGDGILNDPRRSVPMLADSAPELRNVIKAAAGALGIGAPQRLQAASDKGAEFNRLAAEVTGREGLPYNDAVAGVRIAARLGGASAMPGTPAMRPPGERSWVGGSVAVGAPGPAAPPSAGPGYGTPGYGTPGYGAPGTPPPAPQGTMSAGKWGLAALAGIGVLVVVGLSMTPDRGGGNDGQPQGRPPPQQQPDDGPPPQQPPPNRRPPPPQQRPPQQSAGLPVVVPPGGNQQIPAIQVRDAQQAYMMEFGVPAGSQLLRVIVGISRQGWNAGFVAVGSPNAQEPESLSQTGPFQFSRQGNSAVRIMQPQWQRDGLNIGTMCVAFVQNNVQDVQLRGSNVCVLGGNCDKMIGCGSVQ
jgi:hypothetical protein